MLFQTLIIRFWRLHPWRTAVLLVLLALGVGVFLSIRLANKAAVQSFGVFAERITGDSDFRLRNDAGAMQAHWLRDIRRQLGNVDVTLMPIMESTAVWPNRAAQGLSTSNDADDGEVYTLLGLDLFAAAAVTGQRGSTMQGEFVKEPFWESSEPGLWVGESLAKERDLKPGKEIELLVRDQFVTFKVYGVLPEQDGRSLQRNLIVDLPSLQTLTAREGLIDTIEVRLESKRKRLSWLREQLMAAANERWQVEEPDNRRETGKELTRAFRYNLTILSLMALVVGLFLIHQSMDATVVQRRKEIATLRALGVSQAAILRIWLLEGFLLGMIGSAIGVLLGWGLAQWTVAAVARTVNTLYVSTAAQAAHLDMAEVVFGLFLGTGASLLACWGPARRAAKTPPAQLLGHFTQDKQNHHSHWPRFGFAAILIAGSLYLIVPDWIPALNETPISGYTAALLLILGASLSMPAWLKPLARRLSPIGHPVAKLALSRFRNLSGRHRFTAAGLLVAVVLTGSMAVMVHSFERTVSSWIENILVADLYIRPMGTDRVDTRNRIAPSTVASLRNVAGVDEVHGLHKRDIYLKDMPVVLEATELTFIVKRSKALWLVKPPGNQIPMRAAFVSEALARHQHLSVGDKLILPTLAGPQDVQIHGVYAEYGNQRGSIIISQNNYRRWYREQDYLALALFTTPDANPKEVVRSVNLRFPGLFVRTNSELKVMALNVFQQTFALTYALEAIAVFVAVAGLAFALISLLLERRSELTTLRSLGMKRWQMACSTGIEGLLLSGWSAITGLTTGLAVGHILVFNINRNVFGWTLGFTIPWTQLIALLMVVSAIGWLVSFAAGWWGAQLPAEQEE